jgi:hypothetical protein
MISFLFAGLAGRGPDDDIEQLGKKDDDRKVVPSNWWHWSRSMLRMRKRRMLLLAVAVFAIWFLFTHRLRDMLHRGGPAVSDFDLTAAAESRDYTRGQAYTVQDGQSSEVNEVILEPLVGPAPLRKSKKKTGRGPPRSKKTDTKHYYEGPVKFLNLPASLHKISLQGGYRSRNRNVLFAASTLQSVAALIPLACEMDRKGSNYVHMAFMGRNELPIDDILKVNGADKEGCGVSFHDARPEHAVYSSDRRAEATVLAALSHIHDYMHPQAIITDSATLDDDFFVRGVKRRAKEYGWPVIELPPWDAAAEKRIGRPTDSLSWITRLDSVALAAWNLANVEILIHAPTESAGSVIHLLTSLTNADYSGITPPHLTIELPSEVDSMLESWLTSFTWPPVNYKGPSGNIDSRITIRRRIPIHSQSPVEASVRFFESFYPLKPRDSHVLVLSPTVQVSPLFYQSLRYYLLRYKYAMLGPSFPPILGIALDVPILHLNGSSAFVPPDMDALDLPTLQDAMPSSRLARPPFLWEAPNSNAVLYFGDMWREMHSFLSLRLAKFHEDAAKRKKPRQKLVGDHMPAWTEYLLEFMRARGYSLLYPGSSMPSDSMVSVHRELQHGPEEFAKSELSSSTSSTPSKDPPISTDPFLPPSSHAIPPSTKDAKPSHVTTFRPLDALLPFSGADPPLYSLPHLAFDGTPLTVQQFNMLLPRAPDRFRNDVGGCADIATPKGRRRKVVAGSARDLFCFGDEEWVVDDDLLVPFDYSGDGWASEKGSMVGPVEAGDAERESTKMGKDDVKTTEEPSGYDKNL